MLSRSWAKPSEEKSSNGFLLKKKRQWGLGKPLFTIVWFSFLLPSVLLTNILSSFTKVSRFNTPFVSQVSCAKYWEWNRLQNKIYCSQRILFLWCWLSGSEWIIFKHSLGISWVSLTLHVPSVNWENCHVCVCLVYLLVCKYSFS